MNYFLYSKAAHHLKNIDIIEDFPFIWEFGHERYLSVQPSSLKLHYNNGIEICYIKKGRYDWWMEGKEYSVFPGEGFITCPWQYHGNTSEIIDLGEIYWLVLSPKIFHPAKGFSLGEWSTLSQTHNNEIGKILCSNSQPVLSCGAEMERYFNLLNNELVQRNFGFETKIQNIIESLLIEVVRNIRKRSQQVEKDSAWVGCFDQLLKSDLSKKWTVPELAEHFHMGTTAFNEKVKKLSGFTPQIYLVNVRIEQAKYALVQSRNSLTEIALETGFYSSQHFSNAFHQRVGMTPSLYRKLKQKK